MTTKNKDLKERLKRCTTWKEYEDVLKENGFKCDRINGGHKLYTKDGFRTIPIEAHGSPPQGGLKSRVIKQVMIAILGACGFFFFVIPNLFANIV